MKYRIIRTAKADEQIRDIVLYRAELTGNDAALVLLDKLEAGFNRAVSRKRFSSQVFRITGKRVSSADC